MIFLSTVMDEEETNNNNSVEHYDDHGRGLEAAILLTQSPSLHATVLFICKRKRRGQRFVTLSLSTSGLQVCNYAGH